MVNNILLVEIIVNLVVIVRDYLRTVNILSIFVNGIEIKNF